MLGLRPLYLATDDWGRVQATLIAGLLTQTVILVNCHGERTCHGSSPSAAC